MNDEFWGLIVLAIAVVCAGHDVKQGLREVAAGLSARNAILAMLRQHRGARVRGISKDTPQ